MRSRQISAIVCVLGLCLGLLAGHSGLLGQSDTAKSPAVTVPKDLVSYRDVVKKVLPGVVSVQVTKGTTTNKVAKAKPKSDEEDGDVPIPFGRSGDGSDDAIRKFMEEWMKRGGQMPEAPQDPRGQFGSGFIVDPKGVIVTNRHVVNGAGQVEVTLTDGRKFTSKSIAVDAKTDLAVVKLDGVSNLPFLALGDSDAMEIGDRVLAVGAPFGLAGSVSAGIISGKGRNLYMNMYEDFLQTDAAINPGNSGGPLVNLAGQVIAVNTAIKSESGGFQGIGLAIPSEMVNEVVWQLAKDGVVKRGYLGVEIKELDPEVAAKLHLDGEKGIEIGRVSPGSPGAKAGLKDGDIIVSMAGKPIESVKAMQRRIRTAPFGEPMAMSIVRNGQRQTINVTIEQQPQEYGLARNGINSRRQTPQKHTAPDSVALDTIGIEVTDLTSEKADQLGQKDLKGALITAVEPNSAAQMAGLRRGMVIVRAEEKAIDSAQALQERLAKLSLNDGIVLLVRDVQGSTHRVLIKASTD